MMRKKTGAKRMEMTDTARAQRRLGLTGDNHIVLGLVVVPEGVSSHYRITHDESGKATGVIVEVVSIPNKDDLSCHLTGGSFATGFWVVPPVGCEVVVALPDGKVDFHPTIVGVLPTGQLSDRVSADRMVIVSNDPIEIIGPSVKITDSSGDAVELATKQDVQKVVDAINSASFLIPVVTIGPDQFAKGPPADPIPSPSGTSVLRAK